jgi:hypothetical protein
MGRSLGTDVRDAAARPGASGVARGSRVQFVLLRTRCAPLLPASLLLAILVLLIADEPASQLDLETGRQIMRLLLTVVRSEGSRRWSPRTTRP